MKCRFDACLKILAALAVALTIAGPLRAEMVADNPLQPVRIDNPQDTMRTFMEAMNDYRRGVDGHDKALRARLDDAVRCLNLDYLPPLTRTDNGREIAILLREVIDRIIVIDYDLIPAEPVELPWRLKGTEITIARVDEGDRKGQYLFTEDTTTRAHEFYGKVKHLPYLSPDGGARYTEPWLERNVPAWAKREILFFPAWKWIGLFLAILLGLMVKTLTQWLIHHLLKVARKTRSVWDDRIFEAAESPAGLVVASVFWLLAVHILRFEGHALNLLTVAVQVIFSIGLIWVAYNLSDVATDYLGGLTEATESPLDDQMVPLIRKALKVFVVVFGILVTLQNLNFNVMSVLTGLGLGGLAFALAAKDTCANLFGSIMIFLDQPFRIGDWIIAAGQEGTVEEIGFRSTRVRTFYNSVISVPNSVIANANIDNMGRRQYRRIKAFFGITYDTPPETLEAFLEGIKNIVKANPHTRKDYYHVVFNGYGDFSLQVMLYCFLKVPDWAAELVERQNIYLEILRLARDLGVEFAFPTQSLYLEDMPGQPPRRVPPDVDRERLGALARDFGPEGARAHPGGQGLFVPPYRDDRPESRGNSTDDG